MSQQLAELTRDGDAVLEDEDGLTPTADGEASRWSTALYRLLLAIGLIVVWDLVIRLGLVEETFLPTPDAVVSAFEPMLDNGLLHDVWVTLYEALAGFGLAMFVGVVVGLTLGSFPRAADVVAPFIAMFNAMPRIALAPLFVLWFGIGAMSHIFLVFTVILFIVMTNAIAGALSIDRELLTLSRLLGATRWQVIRKVILPTSVPWIFAAMRLAWAWALGSAVVAEMFLGQNGLGYLITAASGAFNVANIFAAIAITVAIAWIVDNIIRFFERKLLRWRPNV